MPWRVPDHFDLGVVHAFEIEQSGSHAQRMLSCIGQPGVVRVILNGHFGPGDRDAVNQTQVDDVAAELGIDYLAQSLQDGGFVK